MRPFVLVALALVLASSSRAEGQAPGSYELRLADGAHPPGDAPDVIAHVPSGFDPAKPLDVVVFLHGFDCCARAMMAAEPTSCRRGEPPHKAWDLAGIHDRAGTNTLLLVPQLAYLERTSQRHRYGKHGAFDAMLAQVLRRIVPGTAPHEREVHGVTLVAHSGGYGALVAILRDADRKVSVRNVVLLDALYAGTDVIASWALAQPDARLVSLHTSQRDTSHENQRLRALLRGRDLAGRSEPSLSETVRAHAFVIRHVSTAHAEIPARHLADVLRGLPFAARETPRAATR